ncbi:PrpF domain-containing protein [Prauserella rugosa]|uniref:2-methylaconitate cis-trans isomerase n=1 Tax=Prauserella rugosa TaxID=43354 RepID=A0A660CB03_9PSEU|nr:PrpF domain-containing protein [Prauserella rugosa]TWH20642.1 hypothetical protein JD82_02489 [Prauserella rugosa]
MQISASWVRGGTSKCWVFEKEHIERTGLSADELLPRVYGSPDLRQIDGVGGATSTTSKAVILEPSADDDLDVVYTFAQVGIEEFKVDWGSNCGNCSATAGLYALERGWVQPAEDVTYVRTFNTNSGQKVVQRIPTPGGALPAEPSAIIPGTVYPGHEVGLGFVEPGGKTTGKLLPTGAGTDVLTVDGVDYPVSIVDAGAPAVILSPETAGLAGLPHAEWAGTAITEKLSVLDKIRRAGAVAMGLALTPEAAERAVPKLGIAGPAEDADADIEVLMLSMGKPHPAMPITGSVAMTMAAFTEGTFLHRAAMLGRTNGKLRFRTPAGIIVTFADDFGGELVVGADRTARTLADATLYIPDPPLEHVA